MSQNKKDNLIIFPGARAGARAGAKPLESPKVKEGKNPADPKKTTTPHSPSAKKTSKKFLVSGTIGALCVLSVGVPMVNKHHSNSTQVNKVVENLKRHNRYIACVSSDTECKKEQEEVLKRELRKKQIKEHKRRWQDQKAMVLIQSGQRKLASVGRPPSNKERFSLQLLKSHYQIQWRRGHLKQAVVIEDQTPVSLPPFEEVVGQYRSLFPAHEKVVKRDFLSGDLEIHELQDKDGKKVAEVETLNDRQGRLLSIHVQ